MGKQRWILHPVVVLNYPGVPIAFLGIGYCRLHSTRRLSFIGREQQTSRSISGQTQPDIRLIQTFGVAFPMFFGYRYTVFFGTAVKVPRYDT